MFCPNCGVQIPNQVPDQAMLCPKCGAKLSRNNRVVARMTDSSVKKSGIINTPIFLPTIIKVLMALETVLSALVFLEYFMRLFDRGEDVLDFMSLYGSSSAMSGAALFFLAVMVPLSLLLSLATGGLSAFVPRGGQEAKAQCRVTYCGVGILVLCLVCRGLGEEFLESLFRSSSSHAGPVLAVTAYLTGWVEEQMGLLLVVGVIPILAAVLAGRIDRQHVNNNL